MELTDKIQKVAGLNAHLQAGMVGFKPLATDLVPAQGVSSLLAMCGGSAWESNPPTPLFRRYTGFEVR